jgi:hypothetical protein
MFYALLMGAVRRIEDADAAARGGCCVVGVAGAGGERLPQEAEAGVAAIDRAGCLCAD